MSIEYLNDLLKSKLFSV